MLPYHPWCFPLDGPSPPADTFKIDMPRQLVNFARAGGRRCTGLPAAVYAYGDAKERDPAIRRKGMQIREGLTV